MQVDLCEESKRYFLKYFLVTQEYFSPSNSSRGGVEVLTEDPKLESTLLKQDNWLIFTGKNLSVPALQFKWATQPSTEHVNHEDHSQGNTSAGQVENSYGNKSGKIL